MSANITKNFLGRPGVTDVGGVALRDDDFHSDADLLVAANLIKEKGCSYCGTAKRSNIAMIYRPLFSQDRRRVTGVVCEAPCYEDYNDALQKPIAELSNRKIHAWLRFKDHAELMAP